MSPAVVIGLNALNAALAVVADVPPAAIGKVPAAKALDEVEVSSNRAPKPVFILDAINEVIVKLFV